MAAATANRYGERQPSEYVPYSGSSGYTYYKDTLLAKDSAGAVIRPMARGVSTLTFLGVVDNKVDLVAGLGSSQARINVWKRGEFTFAANGTGTSAHIGQRAYAMDDQTVGVSMGVPCVRVGEIVGVPTTSTYRVRIDEAVGAWDILANGLSFAYAQNY